MDYSLLLGIHEVGRAEQEEEEEVEEDDGGATGGGDEAGGGPVWGGASYGTSPEGIGSYLNSHRPLGPGDFDPSVDVYALRGTEGEPGVWGGGAGGPGGADARAPPQTPPAARCISWG